MNHLITDAHINKFTSSGHFHRTEPRNFKCKACHTFFGMKESYIHHLETEDHKYICHYCGITTATPSMYHSCMVSLLSDFILIQVLEGPTYKTLTPSGWPTVRSVPNLIQI